MILEVVCTFASSKIFWLLEFRKLTILLGLRASESSMTVIPKKRKKDDDYVSAAILAHLEKKAAIRELRDQQRTDRKTDEASHFGMFSI